MSPQDLPAAQQISFAPCRTCGQQGEDESADSQSTKSNRQKNRVKSHKADAIPASGKEEPIQEKPRQPKAQPKGTTGTSGQKQHSQGGNWKDFLPLLSLALDFLGELRRKIRINRLQMELVLAGDDPCDLAVNYGKAWAALGNLMPLLERAFVIKKRDLEVECDFLAEKTLIAARADISITLGRILSLLLVQGIPVLRELLKIMNKRKGGAKA